MLQIWEDPETVNDNKFVWVSHPPYEQCGITYFPTMSSALDFLNSKNIEVLDINEKYLGTCSACGCYSSLHFTAKINFYDRERQN